MDSVIKETQLCSRCTHRKPITSFLTGYKTCNDYRKKSRDRFKTPMAGFSLYVRNAKKRGIEFNLTIDEFMLFWSKVCKYCGQQYEGAGIDRVDNSIGYVLSNCVSACTMCNCMKMAMDKEDFINQCKLITLKQTGYQPFTFIA